MTERSGELIGRYSVSPVTPEIFDLKDGFATPEEYRANWRKHLCGGALSLYVAEQDEEFMGQAGIVWWGMGDPMINRLIDYRLYSHVLGVYVSSHYRRRGVASELMNKIITEATEKGAFGLCLCVDDRNNEAKRLYERYGFEVAPFSKFVSSPILGEEEVVMTKKLTED